MVDEPSLEITVIQDRAKTACRESSADLEGKCIFYDAAITKLLRRERELNDLFEQSLENKDFQLYLQPKVHPITGMVEGAEALVRWQHPQNGVISI